MPWSKKAAGIQFSPSLLDLRHRVRGRHVTVGQADHRIPERPRISIFSERSDCTRHNVRRIEPPFVVCERITNDHRHGPTRLGRGAARRSVIGGVEISVRRYETSTTGEFRTEFGARYELDKRPNLWSIGHSRSRTPAAKDWS